MSGRLIAIGDIHGYSKSLAALIEAIDPQPADTLVPLGDYVDRGMDTKGVIEQLIGLASRCRLMPILGNHDEMMLAIRSGFNEAFLDWLSFGGTTTLYSYGCQHPREIPESHLAFLDNCLPCFEAEEYFFTHAGYVADLPLEIQPTEVLRWASLRDGPPAPHVSGKTAIVGHTAQRDFEVLDLGHVLCIDTYIYGGGWLTAIDVKTRRIWQADDEGRLRS